MKKLTKKKVKRVSIKRNNPSNLKWKLEDYIRTAKISADDPSIIILDEIKSDLSESILGMNWESDRQVKLLAESFASKSYYYKQLQNIIAKNRK